MRLDLYLVNNKYFESRNKAKMEIENNNVVALQLPLTEEGVKEISEVLLIIFKYIEIIKKQGYEKKYFERRNDCAYLSAALWLTEDKKYVIPLINAIFTICDEYTWCSPAHVHMEKNPSPEKIVGFKELF